jgi:hypothetical protein
MKYNVKQAVSGIQGEMDKASKNQVFNRALGGLASGIEGASDAGSTTKTVITL